MKKFEFDQVTTRGGDRGESSLADGERRRKDDLLFHTLGTIDELSSQIGVARAHLAQSSGPRTSELRHRGDELQHIQVKLQTLAGMVAVPRMSKLFEKSTKIDASDIEKLERLENALMKKTEVPQMFVQPGETIVSAHLHVARTVCRRAERWVVRCIREQGHSHLVPAQQYLNRLSDYLFIMAVWYEQRGKE